MEYEDEYLSEDELRAIIDRKYVFQYYVYFDKNDGSIHAISNERMYCYDTFVEVEFKDIERFFNGTDQHFNYKVVIDADGDINFVHKSQGAVVFKNNIIEHIRLSDRTDTLTVEWTPTGWNFILSESFLTHPRAKSLNSRLPFYVAVEGNINMLVRSIQIQLRNLVTNGIVHIPFTTEKEKLLEVSMFTLPFFDSYGMKINDNN